MKQKIILFVNEFTNIVNFRVDLIRYLINKKYCIEIICYSKNNNKNDQRITKDLKDLKIYYINGSSKSLNVLDELINLLKLIFIVRKLKPNLILSFTVKPNLYSSLLSKLLKIKCILTITGLGSTFIENKKLNTLIFRLFKLLSNDKIIYIFQNNSDKNIFKNKHFLNKNNNYLISGSGVNLKKFSKNFELLKDYDYKQFNFLFIGRLIIHKGVEELYEAALKLISSTKIKIKFLIIGAYDPNDRYSIDKKLYLKIKKNKYFSIIDHTNNIQENILNSHCVILTSKREGLPMSLLEAGAIGRPIIASNVPGCNEVTINDFNGYLYSVGNVDDLYKKMYEVVNLPKRKLLKFSINSNRYVSKNFSSSIINKKYFEIISNLI